VSINAVFFGLIADGGKLLVFGWSLTADGSYQIDPAARSRY